jgi:hypothetical protein
MRAPGDPQELTSDERLQAIAAIFADGIHRLKRTNGLPSLCRPGIVGSPVADRLELSEETRLSVTGGLRQEP